MTEHDEDKVLAEVVEEDADFSSKMQELRAKQSREACLLFFVVVAMLVIPAIWGVLQVARPYERQPLITVGLAGFVFGAALGAYMSVKKQERWWSSCRWAIYGIVSLFACIVVHILVRWPHFNCS